jgi:SPP1 gp7 family putative phage head morphogenesis protein
MPAAAQPSLTEMLVDDANIRSVNLLRVEASMRAKIVQMLRELERELIANISDVIANDPVTAARLKTLLAQVRKTIGSHYANIYDVNAEDLRKVAQAHAYQMVNTVNGMVGVELMSLQTDAQQLQNLVTNTPVMGRYLEEWWQKQSTELFSRFTQQMRLGMLQGEGVNELVQRVRGTRALGYTDAMMRMPTYQAEALVRTATVSVANTGRLQAYTDNADVLEGIQWLATLDDRICEICMALDGAMWALPDGGDPNKYGDYESLSGDKDFPGPTAHVNCRCVQVPVVKSYKDIVKEAAVAGDETDNIDEEMRASMDGQVAEPDGFEGWLKSKDASFQDELLGTEKAQAFRAGEISIKDLTDQSNRPISPDELLKEQAVPVDPKRVARMEYMADAPIKKMEYLGGGIEKTYKITYEDGSHGVFKHAAYENELATSKIAEIGGVSDLVPVASEREITEQEAIQLFKGARGESNYVVQSQRDMLPGVGSVADFVEHGTVADSFNRDSPARWDGETDFRRAAAFDYMIGARDRHTNNWMLQPLSGKPTSVYEMELNPTANKLRLIDNGWTFPSSTNVSINWQELVDHAMTQNMSIPKELVSSWIDSWPRMEEYLNSAGFSQRAIEGMHIRLLELQEKTSFNELTHFIGHGNFQTPSYEGFGRTTAQERAAMTPL